MSRFVSALVYIAAKLCRQVVRVQPEELERNQHKDSPVPDSAFVVLRALDTRHTDDSGHVFVTQLHSVAPARTAGRKDFSGGIDFKIEISIVPWHLKEKLAAAVFPLPLVIRQILHPEVKSADVEIHDKGILGAGDSSAAERSIREGIGPVDAVHDETGAPKFEGGVHIGLFQAGEEGNAESGHIVIRGIPGGGAPALRSVCRDGRNGCTGGCLCRPWE